MCHYHKSCHLNLPPGYVLCFQACSSLIPWYFLGANFYIAIFMCFIFYQKLKDVAKHIKQYNIKMFSTIQILLLIISMFPLILYCRLILALLKLNLTLVIGFTFWFMTNNLLDLYIPSWSAIFWSYTILTHWCC